MDNFSWSDGVRAVFGSCLPCLNGRSTDSQFNDDGSHRVRRARADELEGLLADVDTDTEADTMSLHSNLGSGDANARRKKKRGPKKHVRLWGWDLFGRPPVQLPESDDEGENSIRRQRRRPGTISSSTLDSDASPLDPSTIERLSSPTPHPNFSRGLTDAQLSAEEEAQRLIEERRERKRERREIKRAAKALALGMDEQEFEGFQGSGSNAPSYPQQRMPFVPSHPEEEFGGFVDVDEADAEADEELDFGAESYTRRAPGGGSNGSDSRSRTTTSEQQSGVAYNHHYLSATQIPSSPTAVPLPSSPSPLSDQPPRQKKKKSSGSKKSKSSSSTSQSLSLPSPVQNAFPHRDPHVVEDGNLEEFASPKLNSVNSGFPSVGFGGERRKGGEMGAAFLARRGDQP